MRIAYLAIAGHIHTERWLTFFIDRGHDVHLITVNPEPLAGATVHDLRGRLSWKPLRYATGVLRLRRLLKRIRPDLLHVHFLQGYGYWSIFSGFHPRILTVWGSDVYVAPHTSVSRRLLSRWALKTADLVTGDSQDILGAVERLGANPQQLHLILWGVDFELFQPKDGGDFRRRWDIPLDAPLVLSTRSAGKPYYNIDRIIEMIPRLVDRVPGAIVAFTSHDGDFRGLDKVIAELGVQSSVRLLGRIPRRELPAALGAADVYVSVPSVDATSVALLEAMACEKAIVASDLASNREWINDGENGYVVPAGDVEALAAKTAELLLHPERRSQFGEKSRAIARARAGYNDNMGRMESLCEQLVSSYRPRQPCS